MAGRFDAFLERLSSIVVIVAAVALLWVLLGDGRGGQGADPAGVEELDGTQVVEPPPAASVRGESRARIVVMEFSDFQCPFCGRYARDSYRRLAREYVDTGLVQYVFRHYPLSIHPLAFKAAEAVECAAREGMYWEMHDLLFEGNGALTEQDLLRYAASLGLQLEDFEACLKGGAMAERVMEDRRQGEALGVVATPTFFFAELHEDGKLRLLAKMRGARPYSVFQSTLDAFLSGSSVTRQGQ